MTDTVDALILDLLQWIGRKPRAYAEVIEAWRTSCPRLPVWEEASARGFIERHHEEGTGATVSVTRLGTKFLGKHRPQQSGSTDQNSEGRVHVVEYDASWPSRFERERTILEPVLASWLAGPIEHVGSTAVPGLAAKPVIDIMAAVDSLAASRTAFPALRELGYGYFPYRPETMHWFCKPSPTFRTHHLHLVPFRSHLWVERLAFRDYLRRDSTIAAEYAELKYRLAKQYEFDRESYTDAKEPFVRRVLELALRGYESA